MENAFGTFYLGLIGVGLLADGPDQVAQFQVADRDDSDNQQQKNNDECCFKIHTTNIRRVCLQINRQTAQTAQKKPAEIIQISAGLFACNDLFGALLI